MKPSWKQRLPLLLRLAFVLPVLSIVLINIAAKGPPWKESQEELPLLQMSTLEPAVALAYEIEWKEKYDKGPRVGLLTYAKRNYKRWIREYAESKAKKKLRKYLKKLEGKQ